MRIDVVTLFPEMFEALNHSIVGRARRDGLLADQAKENNERKDDEDQRH